MATMAQAAIRVAVAGNAAYLKALYAVHRTNRGRYGYIMVVLVELYALTETREAREQPIKERTLRNKSCCAVWPSSLPRSPRPPLQRVCLPHQAPTCRGGQGYDR